MSSYQARLRDCIDNHIETMMFCGHSQEFLSKQAFEKIITIESIHDFFFREQDLSAAGDTSECFMSNTIREGRKLFATCVYAGLSQEAIISLFPDGLNDARFQQIQNSPKSFGRHGTTLKDNLKRFHIAYFAPDSTQNLDSITKPIDFTENRSFVNGKGINGNIWSIRIHPDHHSSLGVRNLSPVVDNT